MQRTVTLLWSKCYQVLAKSFALLACLFSIEFCAGQAVDPPTPVINIPTSPEAALLGRFGDIPVGHYTGTSSIAVPLYSVKLGAIEIPLTLRYHSSGIKVEDQATWVGLGWDLSPEGTIIQEIRGKSDDQDLLYDCVATDTNFAQRFLPVSSGLTDYMFTFQWGRETAQNTCLLGYGTPPLPLPPNYADSYCIIDKLSRGFGQPDIYHYDFGGYSGKFYKNPQTGEIILIDRTKQIYFEIINTNTIQATTLDGTVWTFDVPETAEGGIVFEYTGKTYKLGKIALLTGKEVNFSYTEHTYYERVFNQSADITTFSGLPLHESLTYIKHTKKSLSGITSPDTRIDFNTDSRDDINVFPQDNLEKLSSIDIVARANNKKVKSFRFSYDYFNYDYTGVPTMDTFVIAHADALGKRLRLDSVQEIGYTDSEQAVMSKPAYRFGYDTSVVMPLKISFAKDFWGYYNGSANATLLPNLDYFDYFHQSAYQAINTVQTYPYTGANRFTNNTVAGVNMLNRITYPTGGYTILEYEPNSFTNQFIPDQSSAIYKSYYVEDNSNGGTTSALFKLSKPTTIHVENRIGNGQGNPNSVTPLSYAQMQGCYIKLNKVKMINGSPVVTLIKQWDLSTVLNADFIANGGKTWTEDLRMEYDPDPNPNFNYQIQVMYPDSLNNVLFGDVAGVRSHLTFYDDTGVDTTVSNQCGFRIRSIKSYSDSGILASDKFFRYSEGKLLNRFRPLSVYEANDLNTTEVVGGNSYEYIAFYRKIMVSGNDFGTSGGNPIGYGKVEEVERADGNETNGKKVFLFLNSENKTAQDRPYSPDLRNGLPIGEEIIDAHGKKLQEKIYTYAKSIVQPAVANYVCINVVRLSTGSKVPCGNVYYPTIPPSPAITYFYESPVYIGSENGFNAYAIHAEWFNLVSTVTKNYFGSGVLSSEELFTYNEEGNIRTVKTTDSENDTLVTKFYYPNDYQTIPVADNHLTLAHNTGTPVITERYKDSALLSREKIIYDTFPGLTTMLPRYTYQQKGSYPEELRLQINSYDSSGNITQYTPEDGVTVSIVWNQDKTLPIARIENASYATLLALPGGLSADFRIALPQARVTTFVYKPLVGVTVVTDVNNRPTYYEYDAYGRLLLIKDQSGNVIKTYEYHYKQ